jgi:hypothetical protein
VTEAEQKLLNLVLDLQAKALADDCAAWGPVAEAAKTVLQERLPPEYEQTLRAACFRAWQELEAVESIARKHPLGQIFKRRFREEWDRRK